MKRILFGLSSLLALSTLFSLTSCNKEETSDGTQFCASMEDCTSQNGKTTLSGTALNWQSGDRIAVYGTEGCGIYSATPQTPANTAIFDNVSGTTGDPTYRAFYPTTLTTDGVNITLPATQTYVDGSIHEFPMYAESSDNTLSFRNLCGALKLHLTADVNISTIAITAADEINGTFCINYNAGDPQLTHLSGGSSTTTLTCATAQSIAGGKDFFIYLPQGSYAGLRIELSTDDGRHCVKTANTAISVIRSQYTTITLNANNLQFPPIGSKGGLFTINADGDQVWFSQGNLQYQASTNTWRFAENQYDRIGNDNVNISATYSGWIDLFGWGTGNNPTLVSYSPSDYTTFVDWGTNAICNGGNTANYWRSLTRQEWNYIFYSRSNASSKYGGGKVNGVGGIIILPDYWIMPSGCNFDAGMDGWDDNVYTTQQWTRMEQAGAIFLPGTGVRVHSSSSPSIITMASIYEGRSYDVNNFGNYWTATQGEQWEGYSVAFFGEERLFGIFDWSGRNGRAVRLAKLND